MTKVGQRPIHKYKEVTATDAKGNETYSSIPLDPDTNKPLTEDQVVSIPLDKRQTCLVVYLSEHGLTNKKPAIDTLRDIAINQCKIPEAALHIGGPAVDNVAIDDAGQRA